VLGVADFFGIYFAEKYIGGAIDVRVPIIGWGLLYLLEASV